MIYSGVNVSTIKRTITVYRVSNGVHRERQVESVQLGKSLDFDISDMSILLGLEPFQKLAVVVGGGGWWSKGILEFRFGPNLGLGT